jgi:WD40 repeat protein
MVEREKAMKQRIWLLSVIVLTLSAILLNACSYSVQVLATPNSSTPTEAQITVVPSATQPDATATPVQAAATPTLISIRADTIYMLETFKSFEMGEIVRSLAFTPDGTTLAAAGGNTGDDYAIHLWDVASGQPVGILGGHRNIVWGIAFSPDGKLIASVSSDGTAQVHDWRTADVEKILNFPNQVVSVSFSPDGQALAVGGVDKAPNAAVWTYSVGSWEPLLKFPEFLNVTALAYSPKGGTLIGGGTSRNVQVWRTDNGAPQFTLNHAHQVSKAVISPDGSTVATGTCATAVNGDCTEGAVWLWDLPTGKLLKKLGGFPTMVESLAFSADGSALIVSSRDGTLRVYDTSNYQSVFEVVAQGGIETLALSPDSGLLATGNDNGDINLWKIVYHP